MDAKVVPTQPYGFSVSLLDATSKQLAFLRASHASGEALKSSEIEKFRRYTTCWLPLVASLSEEESKEVKLVPPSDCAWLWHAHRLAPRSYGRARQHYGLSDATASYFTLQAQTEYLRDISVYPLGAVSQHVLRGR